MIGVDNQVFAAPVAGVVGDFSEKGIAGWQGPLVHGI